MMSQYGDSQEVWQLLSLWWVLLEEQQLQDGVHRLQHQMLELSSSKTEPGRLLSSIQPLSEHTDILNRDLYPANGSETPRFLG